MKIENPIFNKGYRILAYKLCNRLGVFSIPFVVEQMKKIKPLLSFSNLRMTEEEYFGTILFTSALVLPFELIIIQFIINNFRIVTGDAAWLMAAIFSPVISLIILGLFLIYPAYRIDNIKRNIEANISYASMHMATIAGTGVPSFMIFEMMGNFPEYGEISKECKRISRNIRFFGYDMLTTLSETAARTPSTSFKDLLWGMVSIIRTGGDSRQFLIEKSRQYLDKQKNIEREYLDNLSIMAELYITLFVAGPVLLVIMLTIIGSMSNLGLPVNMILAIFIYFLLPVMSIGYMIMLEGSKPVGLE